MFGSKVAIFAVLLIGFVLVANVRCAPENVSFFCCKEKWKINFCERCIQDWIFIVRFFLFFSRFKG